MLSFGPLIRARLVRRYKRFLADVELESGELVTAHCPNPGRMTSILPETDEVYLTDLGDSPKRKLRYRWELARTSDSFILVNTQWANKVAAELLLPEAPLHSRLGLASDAQVKPETRFEGSRFDFAYPRPDGLGYLEVKQVTLRVSDQGGKRWAAFPDAVTARGRRHLEHLTQLAREGIETRLLYVVGREDVDAVRAANEVDPEYAQAFENAIAAGVQVHAAGMSIGLEGLRFSHWIPVP